MTAFATMTLHDALIFIALMTAAAGILSWWVR